MRSTQLAYRVKRMVRTAVTPAFSRRFGRRLRMLREQMRPPMSTTGLAVRAGISIAYVSQLESGKRSPSLAALFALAGALRCEPWELLILDPNDPRVLLLDAIR